MLGLYKGMGATLLVRALNSKPSTLTTTLSACLDIYSQAVTPCSLTGCSRDAVPCCLGVLRCCGGGRAERTSSSTLAAGCGA